MLEDGCFFWGSAMLPEGRRQSRRLPPVCVPREPGGVFRASRVGRLARGGWGVLRGAGLHNFACFMNKIALKCINIANKSLSCTQIFFI